jgi:hypothetical protein
VNTTHQYVEADLSMKEKALGNIGVIVLLVQIDTLRHEKPL